MMEDHANDWQGRARREAVAILAEALPQATHLDDYQTMIGLVAIGWLQGVSYGTHDTMALAEQAFARLQADLTS